MPTRGRDSKHRRRRLAVLRWLSSPAGLAIFALISSVVGGLVTAVLQDVKSRREIDRTWIQECSKHQMVVRKLFLDEQAAAVDQLYTAISNLHETSVYLIDLTRPEFAKENFSDAGAAAAVATQKTETLDRFNAALDSWQRAKYLGDFRLNDYAGDQADLQRSWSSTRHALTTFSECASEWYLAVFRKEAVYATRPCVTQEKALDVARNELSASLRRSRHAAWRDWETPEQFSAPPRRPTRKPAV
jgi:hypothetical protein